MPTFPSADWDDVKQRPDFLGLNIYRAESVRATEDGAFQALPVPAGFPRSGVDWQPMTPDALYYGPRFFPGKYSTPAASGFGRANLHGTLLGGVFHRHGGRDRVGRSVGPADDLSV